MNPPTNATASRPRQLPRWIGRVAGAAVLLGIALLGTYVWRPDLLLDAEFARQVWRAGVSYDATLVDDHLWIYYDRHAGEGAGGAPVLLLHGFTGSKENFLPLVAEIDGGGRVIVPDLPGWGASTRRLHSDYGIAAQVARLERFLDEQQIERVHLVGHSMGGHIAGVFAATHPERVESLALIDSAGVRFKPNAFALRVMRGETPFNVRTAGEFDGLMAQLFAQPPWLPPRMRDVLLARNRSAHAFQSKVFASIGTGRQAFQLEDNLPRIHSPTLVLWCRDDRILDVSSVATLAHIRPQPTVTVLPSCGHMAMMEKPRDFAGSLQAHWRGIGSPEQPRVAAR